MRDQKWSRFFFVGDLLVTRDSRCSVRGHSEKRREATRLSDPKAYRVLLAGSKLRDPDWLKT